MSAAWTPGPWMAVGDPDLGRWCIDTALGVESTNEYVIADDIVGRDAEANARLIAAAPDMFEALEAVVECFIKRGPWDEPLGESEQAPSINAACDALAKARGQSGDSPCQEV